MLTRNGGGRVRAERCAGQRGRAEAETRHLPRRSSPTRPGRTRTRPRSRLGAWGGPKN
jgi:hypothetical protein